MKSTLLRLATAALLSVSVTAVLAQDAPAPETVTITVLAAGDMDSFDTGVDGPRGGFARLNALAKAEKAANPNMLYLYSGDLISPSLLSGIDGGANTIELTNLVPFDVAVPGNHEFDFGPEVFLDRAAESVFPWSAVNITSPDGSPIEGLSTEPVVKEIAGVKIGIVPVATDETPELSSPGDYKFAPTVESALAGADEVREQGADIVIALVHASHPQDEAMYDSGKFDLILSGHDHDYRIHYNDIVGYVETSNDANLLTAIDLAVEITPENGEDPRTVTWRPNFRFIDTATVEPDADTVAVIDRLQTDLDNELNVEIGTLANEMDSRRATVRGQESAWGNLITDAIKSGTGADVAMYSGGGIRGDKVYPAGTVLTRKDVFTEMPFGNRIVMAEVSGADLLAALENGFSQVEDGAGRFPQVSGIKVEADLTKPAGQRVTTVEVNGAPLDPAATYKLATTNFQYGGGDGYNMLANGELLINEQASNLDASTVINYITALGGTVDSKVEGRITLTR
ncbi:MAG TPA: bifunctional UDP-sugar hydrolase/5'-nucleotidase [Devosia sp.]|jgi:2',3'-cyclic-nucleotide 2'-phosphodiesterase (5'-nucleotidase family)|nr:bifunctional UDP-sugar hydrolase/5'-nucleotidase [Devosia sp.]